ncbi:MAG: delta(1)-pyrroline-2-carboxylate reductase family protein [Variovorax sp.]
MLELNAPDTDAHLSHAALLRALDRMLALRTAGLVHCPTRGVLPMAAGGRLLSMLASDGTHALVKTVTVHPENARFALPRVQAEAVVLRADNGARVAILDGDVLTLRRTAALSVLAVDKLCALPPRRLLIIGAGVQARAHLDAFVAQGEVSHVGIYARNAAAAVRLVEAVSPLARARRLTVAAVDDLASALPGADVVVTATNSIDPVLSNDQADTVSDGTVVCAVGAFTAQMSELPPSLVRRSAVVVDALEACRSEAGDLIKADVDWHDVHELGFDRPALADVSRPIIFKSVGCALWDLAAANCALDAADFHSQPRSISHDDHPEI